MASITTKATIKVAWPCCNPVFSCSGKRVLPFRIQAIWIMPGLFSSKIATTPRCGTADALGMIKNSNPRITLKSSMGTTTRLIVAVQSPTLASYLSCCPHN
ncbi:hypothetical protein AMTR_s00001p00271160 [Amborella trichopoda]|uniref:Uncharacterized protein n=1 Tax=Amborella trichopoda TaxID=13333 RepID=W1NMT1_AMBTC|nr:hypothetical protein AMTR_s00001p00271160 [Amborella trichopoda]